MKKILISLAIVLCTYTSASACDIQKIETLITIGSSEIEDGQYCDAYKLHKRAQDILKRDRSECIRIFDVALIELLEKKMKTMTDILSGKCGE